MAGQRHAEAGRLTGDILQIKRDDLATLKKELTERRDRAIADTQALTGALQAIDKIEEMHCE